MAKGPKNTFDDLSNHLFEQLERLNDAEEDELDGEIKRSKAIADIADKIINMADVIVQAEKVKSNSMGECSFPRLLGGGNND